MSNACWTGTCLYSRHKQWINKFKICHRNPKRQMLGCTSAKITVIRNCETEYRINRLLKMHSCFSSVAKKTIQSLLGITPEIKRISSCSKIMTLGEEGKQSFKFMRALIINKMKFLHRKLCEVFVAS